MMARWERHGGLSPFGGGWRGRRGGRYKAQLGQCVQPFLPAVAPSAPPHPTPHPHSQHTAPWYSLLPSTTLQNPALMHHDLPQDEAHPRSFALKDVATLLYRQLPAAVLPLLQLRATAATAAGEEGAAAAAAAAGEAEEAAGPGQQHHLHPQQQQQQQGSPPAPAGGRVTRGGARRQEAASASAADTSAAETRWLQQLGACLQKELLSLLPVADRLMGKLLELEDGGGGQQGRVITSAAGIRWVGGRARVVPSTESDCTQWWAHFFICVLPPEPPWSEDCVRPSKSIRTWFNLTLSPLPCSHPSCRLKHSSYTALLCALLRVAASAGTECARSCAQLPNAWKLLSSFMVVRTPWLS